MNKFVAFLMHTPKYCSAEEAGQYNGYIAVHKSIKLPLSFQGYYDQNVEEPEKVDYLDNYVDVHGGITFDHNGEELNDDLVFVPIDRVTDNFKDYRVIGFDTCHYGDNSSIWNFEAVKAETLKLKQQLISLYEDIELTKEAEKENENKRNK